MKERDHGMNETERNRRGIYSHKRRKLGEIILKFKIPNKIINEKLILES